MKFFGHAEGYIDVDNGNKYVYQYKDHLGNVRLSYLNIGTSASPNLEIQEENNYYPFGLKQKGYNSNTGSYTNIALKRKFNGKEFQDELEFNSFDFGARLYDVSLGRWISIDPLSESFYSDSPYNSMMNNPLSLIDPDGQSVVWKPRVNDNGSVQYIAEKGDSAATFAKQFELGKGEFSEKEELQMAERITGTKGNEIIKEGTEVSGGKVKEVTGNEVAKLDLTSPMATNQRVFDQFIFASDYESFKGEEYLFTGDYYGNIFGGTSNKLSGSGNASGDAVLTLGNGERIDVYFNIAISAGTNRYNEYHGHYIGTYPIAADNIRSSMGIYAQRYRFENFGELKPYRFNRYSEIQTPENAPSISSRFRRFKTN